MPPPPGGRLAVHDRPYLVGYLPVDGLRAERAERAAHLSAPPPPPRPYAAPAAGPPRGGSVAVTAAHVRGVLARDPGPPRNGAPAPVGRGAGHLVPGPAASRGVPAAPKPGPGGPRPPLLGLPPPPGMAAPPPSRSSLASSGTCASMSTPRARGCGPSTASAPGSSSSGATQPPASRGNPSRPGRGRLGAHPCGDGAAHRPCGRDPEPAPQPAASCSALWTTTWRPLHHSFHYTRLARHTSREATVVALQRSPPLPPCPLCFLTLCPQGDHFSPLSLWSRARSVRFALQPAKSTSQGPPWSNPRRPFLAAEPAGIRSFASSFCPQCERGAESAPRSESPGGGHAPARRVGLHGPGRRRAGRFFQLLKERYRSSCSEGP